MSQSFACLCSNSLLGFRWKTLPNSLKCSKMGLWWILKSLYSSVHSCIDELMLNTLLGGEAGWDWWTGPGAQPGRVHSSLWSCLISPSLRCSLFFLVAMSLATFLSSLFYHPISALVKFQPTVDWPLWNHEFKGISPALNFRCQLFLINTVSLKDSINDIVNSHVIKPAVQLLFCSAFLLCMFVAGL